jgi:WXG100 family type VII secretion target
MAGYVANAEQILVLIDKARRIGEQIDTRISQVEREVATLHVEWDGDAAEAHRSHTDTWQREMGDMKTALAALEASTQNAHDGYLANVEHNVKMWP